VFSRRGGEGEGFDLIGWLLGDGMGSDKVIILIFQDYYSISDKYMTLKLQEDGGANAAAQQRR
jgi:hypothetical protein